MRSNTLQLTRDNANCWNTTVRIASGSRSCAWAALGDEVATTTTQKRNNRHGFVPSVFGVRAHDFLVFPSLLHVRDYFLMDLCSHDGVGIFTIFLLFEWSRETTSIVFCGSCLRVCLLVCTVRLPYSLYRCS